MTSSDRTRARARRPRGRTGSAAPLILLGLAGRGRVAGAAHALPRAERELVLAVEAVAGVRGRVAAGLAGGDRLERGGGGCFCAGPDPKRRLARLASWSSRRRSRTRWARRGGRLVAHCAAVGPEGEAAAARGGDLVGEAPGLACQALLRELGVVLAHLRRRRSGGPPMEPGPPIALLLLLSWVTPGRSRPRPVRSWSFACHVLLVVDERDTVASAHDGTLQDRVDRRRRAEARLDRRGGLQAGEVLPARRSAAWPRAARRPGRAGTAAAGSPSRFAGTTERNSPSSRAGASTRVQAVRERRLRPDRAEDQRVVDEELVPGAGDPRRSARSRRSGRVLRVGSPKVQEAIRRPIRHAGTAPRRGCR